MPALGGGRRCKVTGNQCGTDTWMVGYTCPCVECAAWVEERRFSSVPEPPPIPTSIRPTPKRSKT